jgi:hypothetical protein
MRRTYHREFTESPFLTSPEHHQIFDDQVSFFPLYWIIAHDISENAATCITSKLNLYHYNVIWLT